MESPQRPFVVWAFDASKQAVAGMTVHILNIGIAEYLTHAVGAAALKVCSIEENDDILSSQRFFDFSSLVSFLPSFSLKSDECDFYFVNFVIDIFVGVTVTYLLLAIVGVFAEKFNFKILRTG